MVMVLSVTAASMRATNAGSINRSIETYHKKTVWKALQEKVMQLDYSWDASAKKYVSLYMKALAKIGIAAL